MIIITQARDIQGLELHNIGPSLVIASIRRVKVTTNICPKVKNASGIATSLFSDLSHLEIIGPTLCSNFVRGIDHPLSNRYCHHGPFASRSQNANK